MREIRPSGSEGGVALRAIPTPMVQGTPGSRAAMLNQGRYGEAWNVSIWAECGATSRVKVLPMGAVVSASIAP